MNAQEIIHYIATSEKKTPVKLYIKSKAPIDFGDAKVFGAGDKIVFGDWKALAPIIEAHNDEIEEMVIENDCRNSAIPLLDIKDIPARIEPGAVIRENVEIGKSAVIMMGAIINIRRSDRRGHNDRHGRSAGRARDRGRELPHRRGARCWRA